MVCEFSRTVYLMHFSDLEEEPVFTLVHEVRHAVDHMRSWRASWSREEPEQGLTGVGGVVDG